MSSTVENELNLILIHFDKVRSTQLDLCSELENIADGLGGQIDRRQCAVMAGELERVMNEAHSFEKDMLFPALKHAMDENNTPQNERVEKFGFLTQLENAHEDDVGLAGEVSEALNQFAYDPVKMSPDAMGYLLRSFLSV